MDQGIILMAPGVMRRITIRSTSRRGSPSNWSSYLTNFLRIDVDLKERDKTASRDGIMKKVISSFLLLAALGLDSTVLFWNSSAPRAESQARIDAQLLPPPITRRNPATVVVQLESFEKRGQLADGVEYEFWTFGDSVPGPLVRVREGDAVELHFKNNAA